MAMNSQELESFEEQNFMNDAYNDPKFNRYDSGPGSFLPDELQPGALAAAENRKAIGVFLKEIKKELSETGVRNLCSKYGRVVSMSMFDKFEDRRTKCAMVFFGTLNDAEQCIRCINDGSTGIRAFFLRYKENQHQTEGVSNESVPPENVYENEMPSNYIRKINGPFSNPKQFTTALECNQLLSTGDYDQCKMLQDCDPQMDFLNGKLNNKVLSIELRDDKIINGHFNYQQSTKAKNEMKILQNKSKGILNEEKKEFLYNADKFASKTGNCKSCGNVTNIYCEGCKEDFYCSQKCWEKYNRNQGCKCQKLESDEKSRRLRYGGCNDIIGRGGKVITSRPDTTTTESSSPTLPTGKLSSRMKMLRLKRRLDLEAKQKQRRTIGLCEPPAIANKLVVITTVINHKNVFLRSNEQDEHIRYVKYMNDVAEASKTAKSLEQMPVKGDVVLADFEGAFYRALVVRIEDDLVVVAYIEFGNMCKIPLTSLKELPEDLRYEKRFTFRACLSGVQGGLISDKPLAYLYDLLKGAVSLKFQRKDDAFTSKGVLCELVRDDTNENVNITITKLNNIKADEKIVTFEDIECKTLNGENIRVTVLDNSTVVHGYITLIRNEDIEKLLLMQQRIAEYCMQEYEGPYRPIDTEICLAKSEDNRWYRVQLGESVGDGNPLMIFTDFGNMHNINVKNMRRMPVEFTYPCYSVFAEIGDIPQVLSNEQIVALRDRFSNQSNIVVSRCRVRKAINANDNDTTILYFDDLKL